MNVTALSVLERELHVSYPASFHLAIFDLMALMKTSSFAASFPETCLLLTVSEVEVAQEVSGANLLPFMRSENKFPDIYAFDLTTPGPEYAVVVWCMHTAVHQCSGFDEFLAWVEERCVVDGDSAKQS